MIALIFWLGLVQLAFITVKSSLPGLEDSNISGTQDFSIKDLPLSQQNLKKFPLKMIICAGYLAVCKTKINFAYEDFFSQKDFLLKFLIKRKRSSIFINIEEANSKIASTEEEANVLSKFI